MAQKDSRENQRGRRGTFTSRPAALLDLKSTTPRFGYASLVASERRRCIMPVHLTDSLIYQNSWGTPELRALFDDVPRTRFWLEILAALAETQAEFGLIPPEAAQAVATTCRTVELDTVFFEEVRAGFE